MIILIEFVGAAISVAACVPMYFFSSQRLFVLYYSYIYKILPTYLFVLAQSYVERDIFWKVCLIAFKFDVTAY